MGGSFLSACIASLDRHSLVARNFTIFFVFCIICGYFLSIVIIIRLFVIYVKNLVFIYLHLFCLLNGRNLKVSLVKMLCNC